MHNLDLSQPLSGIHTVLKTPILPPFPAGLQQLQLGMGCFWGAERKLWQQPGVYSTAVGYSGGALPQPSYQQVCSGNTGHAETVLVIYDPRVSSLQQLLQVFFTSHDPTQGNRQGNDIGSQYRSVCYLADPEQLTLAQQLAKQAQAELSAKGFGQITTEFGLLPTFYYAEEYHQQYLQKNPQGYCGLKGTGITCSF